MNNYLVIALLVAVAAISGLAVHQSSALLGLTSQGIMNFNLEYFDCNAGFFGGGDGICSTTPTDLPDGQQTVIGVSGDIQNLYVEVDFPTNANYTVYVNNSPTTLKCSMSNTDVCHDTTHGITVSPADTVMIYQQTDATTEIGRATIVEMS